MFVKSLPLHIDHSVDHTAVAYSYLDPLVQFWTTLIVLNVADMATFAVLPNEILELIIAESRPDGFEGLALTCWRLYTLSHPLIRRHKQLRRRFENFLYFYVHLGQSLVAASDIISLVAHEPVVARYIKSANLEADSEYLARAMLFEGKPKHVPSIDDGGPVVDLFANSTYLKQAGIDWREYYTTFETDVREQRYSQNGSAFLLTLLPRAQKLTMPHHWKSNVATDALLSSVVDRAKQSKLQHQKTSLASVTEIFTKPSCQRLNAASKLVALPQVELYSWQSCYAVSNHPDTLGFAKVPYVAETLRTAVLDYCHIDHIGITSFLRCAPQLKTLRYTHHQYTGVTTHSWDICAFMKAIAREAGDHLVALSVVRGDPDSPIVGGKASMRGFRRLEKLEVAMEVVLCTANATGLITYLPSSLQDLMDGIYGTLVPNLVPPTVSHLSLVSVPGPNHEMVPKVLFGSFPAVRKAHLPVLQELYIGCRQNDSVAYKERLNKIVREGRGEGVQVKLAPCDVDAMSHWLRQSKTES